MVDLVEETVLVVRYVRPGFVIADGHAVMMCLKELAAQANVVDLGAVRAEVAGEVQRQMMDRIERDDPVKQNGILFV